jgi:predicted O-methyltransferase YrrM
MWSALRVSGAPQAFPPGAFYSPVVDAELVRTDAERIWPAVVEDPPGIDLRGSCQLALLERIARHPLPDPAGWPEPVYDPGNDQFPPQDAAVLYGMLRLLAPARMVEVGCGWSTTVAARAIADGGVGTELVCVEPYPRAFLHEVSGIHQLRRERVEQTPLEVFERLGRGDVLFIDSSHVVKTGSDVVHVFLQVLPRLRDGVVVHVHDVFIPLDYPRGWVERGFNWNEQYLLQAYLAGNARVRVLCANRWLSLRHANEVERCLGPRAAAGGSSFWFEVGRS